jgi:hypothetical protein
VGRGDVGHPPALGATSVGPPGMACPCPDACGESTVGAASQAGAALGAPDEAGGAALVARGRNPPQWRPGRQRPRMGRRVCPQGRATGRSAADGRRVVCPCAPTRARHQRAAAGARRALAATGSRAHRCAARLAARARALVERSTPATGGHPRDGGVVWERPAGVAAPRGARPCPPRPPCATRLCRDRPPDRPRALGPQCVTRWAIATTVEARRAHLGLDPPRRWSALALGRAPPGRRGRSSVTALLVHAVSPEGNVPVQPTAWDAQAHATCAAVWAAVRPQRWAPCSDATSAHASDLGGIPRSARSRVGQAVCSAHGLVQSRAKNRRETFATPIIVPMPAGLRQQSS